MFIASSKDVMGEVPGLQSVETAIGTPAARKADTGGGCVSRKKYYAPGSSTATVPCRAMAATPSGDRNSRGSADKPL